MIVTKVKPLNEILSFIEPFRKILVLGCDGCTQPPRSIKEAEVYAEIIRLAGKLKEIGYECKTATLSRQCDNYVLKQNLPQYLQDVDAVLSMACGIGPQTIVEVFPDINVFPAQDTLFMGSENKEEEIFLERCRGCGECVLGITCGICPIASCSKSLLNGPCGGSVSGKCEVSPEIDCGWHLIIERMKKLGKLDSLRKLFPAKDWSKSSYSAVRKIKLEVENESRK
jgi:hypothetical protein